MKILFWTWSIPSCCSHGSPRCSRSVKMVPQGAKMAAPRHLNCNRVELKEATSLSLWAATSLRDRVPFAFQHNMFERNISHDILVLVIPSNRNLWAFECHSMKYVLSKPWVNTQSELHVDTISSGCKALKQGSNKYHQRCSNRIHQKCNKKLRGRKRLNKNEWLNVQINEIYWSGI